MENFLVTPNEIDDIIKTRYEFKNNNNKELNIEEISKEEINNFVINCEKDRFYDLFNRVFEEEILPIENSNVNSEDCEDGPINEICLKIISEIKSTIKKLDKEKILKFCFKIISQLLLKKEE